MSLLIVDSNVLIDYAHRVEPLTGRLSSLVRTGEPLAITAVQVGECFAGASPTEAMDWSALLSSLLYLEITFEQARLAGEIRYRLRRLGQHMTLSDSLIAAVALDLDATLMTGNVKRFPLRGLRVRSLRD